jgi:pre-rRNA-processing protein TSR1
LDSRNECSNLVRTLCSVIPKGIRWRDDRSWLFIDECSQLEDSIQLSGFVRGKQLNPDRLVSIGDELYRIKKITDAHGITLAEPTAEQDNYQDLADEDLSMGSMDDRISLAPSEQKGVLLDDHHYFSDGDEEEEADAPKKVPKGTSTYQSAWFLGNESDSEDGRSSDGEELELAEDDVMDTGTVYNETIAPTEGGESEMFLDPAPQDEAEQIAAFRAERNEANEDLEFPDEIELHPNALGKERLAKYRGLKSLRTSPWQEDEDIPFEPENWKRLLKITDYKASKNKAFREVLAGGVASGTKVIIYLEADKPAPTNATLLVSLLRHEQKQAVSNYSLTLSSSLEEPLKAKTELYMQCGSRHLKVTPILSEYNNTKNNVHKFNRYLHPGQTAVATVIAPLTWGTTPTLFFLKGEDGALTLAGTGSSLPPDTARVVAKRTVLTGHPYKIHRRLVTVRYMFFNNEDVNWFKALPLWTRRGRSGFIKESLGTHGYFKATFDGKLNPQDSVAVSLYKRVFPRMAEKWTV